MQVCEVRMGVYETRTEAIRNKQFGKRHSHWNLITQTQMPTYKILTKFKLNGTLAWTEEKKMVKSTRELRKSVQRDKKKEEVCHKL